jgi:hypothetical protein
VGNRGRKRKRSFRLLYISHKKQLSNYMDPPIKIDVFSLKPQILQELETLLRILNISNGLAISKKTLMKKDLRGFKYTGNADLVILHHKIEGRLFLTDRNGFYNDFIESVYSQLRGRILILISNAQSDPEESKLYTDEIDEVSKFGDQPTIGILAQKQKVICYKLNPTQVQRAHIISTILKSAFFRENEEYEGRARNFQSQQSVFKCSLL